MPLSTAGFPSSITSVRVREANEYGHAYGGIPTAMLSQKSGRTIGRRQSHDAPDQHLSICCEFSCREGSRVAALPCVREGRKIRARPLPTKAARLPDAGRHV